MNSFRHVTLVFTALIFLCSRVTAQTESDVEKNSYPSPDGKFTVHLKMDEGNLSIKNNQTGAVDESQEVLTPVFTLKWSGDSKTIITVSHLAGGSFATIFHFDKAAWSHFDVEPSDENMDVEAFDVIQQDIGLNTLKLTYKVTEVRKSDEDKKAWSFYKFRYSINPETRAIIRLKKQEISFATYGLLGGDGGK